MDGYSFEGAWLRVSPALDSLYGSRTESSDFEVALFEAGMFSFSAFTPVGLKNTSISKSKFFTSSSVVLHCTAHHTLLCLSFVTSSC